MKRYSRDPLPAYAHVPGKTPHPIRDPKGHSYGQEGQPRTEPFLYGVDLFNAGFYWEAHETWEGLWKEFDSQAPEARFLQALIQIAAARLKERMGNPAGVERLLTSARLNVDRVLQAGVNELWGIQLQDLRTPETVRELHPAT